MECLWSTNCTEDVWPFSALWVRGNHFLEGEKVKRKAAGGERLGGANMCRGRLFWCFAGRGVMVLNIAWLVTARLRAFHALCFSAFARGLFS